ncbi:hypothetical protein BMF35_a2315 [Aurantiacibacter gangjinensis]|nr:hypothetical protein BMF35_a2315 [Aurantiacibacter gangjinensis]
MPQPLCPSETAPRDLRSVKRSCLTKPYDSACDGRVPGA